MPAVTWERVVCAKATEKSPQKTLPKDLEMSTSLLVFMEVSLVPYSCAIYGRTTEQRGEGRSINTFSW